MARKAASTGPSPRLTPESVWPFFVSFICAEALMVLPVLMT